MRTPKPNRYYNSAGCLVISSTEMLEVTTKLKQLESQLQHNMTMAVAVAQYEAKITSQHNLNLPAHAFWTANTVVDPDTGASLEYIRI